MTLDSKHILLVLFTTAAVLISTPASSTTTYYDNLAEWQAAVGSYQVEDFESYQPAGFPQEGGQIPLNHFILEADDNGDDEWGPGGIMNGNWNEFYTSGPPLGMGFITTLETLCDEDERCGPTYERAIFPQPINAIFVDVPWTEAGYLGLTLGDLGVGVDEDNNPNKGSQFGAIFDESFTTVSFNADHSWAFIDTIYWTSVSEIPEPSTLLLTTLGLLIAAAAKGSQRR